MELRTWTPHSRNSAAKQQESPPEGHRGLGSDVSGLAEQNPTEREHGWSRSEGVQGRPSSR